MQNDHEKYIRKALGIDRTPGFQAIEIPPAVVAVFDRVEKLLEVARGPNRTTLDASVAIALLATVNLSTWVKPKPTPVVDQRIVTPTPEPAPVKAKGDRY